MKILFVHNKYKFKGGEDTTLEMESSLLVSKGHEVEILEFDNYEITGLISRLKIGASSFYNFQSAKRFKKKVLNLKPDIIHIHNLFFTASPSIIYIAKKLNIPVVMTVQNFRLICANALLLRNSKICELCVNKKLPLAGIKYKCYRSSYIESALVTAITSIHKALSTWNKMIDKFIAPSEFLKTKLLHSSLELDETKIAVKPNFVLDVFEIDEGRNDFFLFVGRLAPEKGIEVLLKCFGKNSNAKLIIAGDGPEKENLLINIKNNQNISYLGHQPKNNILKLMRKSKALIFPSIWYEGLPLTIIEAFSTGTPIIASRLGAMEELIEDGYNGFLFNPGDADDLKRKIQLFNNTPGIQSVYENARKTYLTRYTPETNYAAIIDIYKNAIMQKSKMPL